MDDDNYLPIKVFKLYFWWQNLGLNLTVFGIINVKVHLVAYLHLYIGWFPNLNVKLRMPNYTNCSADLADSTFFNSIEGIKQVQQYSDRGTLQ